MTVTVYVWLPRLGQVGHASMELGNGTYISLWPGESKAGKSKKKKDKKKKSEKKKKTKKDPYNERSESWYEDIENEGRWHDQSFKFEGLDEDAIQRWWDDFNTSWNLFGQNCCKTVIDGLRIGGSESRLSFMARSYYAVTLLWTPFRVMTYCSQMRKE